MEEVGMVAWEVLKLLLLNGVAIVEGRELGDKELLVLRTDVVLVTAVNLLVNATVLLVEEDDLDMINIRLEPPWLPGTLANRILSLNLLLSLFCFSIWGCHGG